MKELDKILAEARIIPAITIQDRINEIQVLLQGIQMQEIKIKTIGIEIKNNDLLSVFSDELEQEQEKQKETLRGLKNSLVLQTLVLHKQTQREL